MTVLKSWSILERNFNGIIKLFCIRTLTKFTKFICQILTIRLNYKLQWKESRMTVNETADWNSGEINISPDNIDVRTFIIRAVLQ